MKSVKKMLLGAVIALFGLGIVQPLNNALLFRSLMWINSDVFSVYLPLLSILLILAGTVIAVMGYYQKDK